MQLRMETGINYSTLTALPWLLMLPSVVTAPTYMVEVWVDPDPSAEGLYVSWSKDHLGQTRIRRIVDWIAPEFE